MTLQRIILACIYAVIAWLVCIFVGGLLATTGVPIAVFVGGFLVQWAVVISIIVFVYTLFAGGTFPAIVRRS